MADSKPQTTRQVASALMDLDGIAQVVDHNGSIGAIDFTVHRDSAVSQNRIEEHIPDGWYGKLVVTPGSRTSLYIEQE